MYLLARWFVNALALLLVAQLVPGFMVQSFYTALIAALILGLLNATIRPLLVLLTLPINILTLGLFTLVINALIILLMASVVKGVEVQGFGAALSAGLILWLISWAVNSFIRSSSSSTQSEA